jgi:DNA-binding transcriptional LysR family regulator
MTRELFDQSCSAAGIRPRIFLESDSPHTLIALAQEGHGIAVLSSSASIRLQMDGAVPLTVARRPIRRMVSVVWHPDRHRPPGFARLLDLLSEHAAQWGNPTDECSSRPIPQSRGSIDRRSGQRQRHR